MTPEAARTQLQERVLEVKLAGPGLRNASLNLAAEWLGRLVGAGLLAELEVGDTLAEAARASGLRIPEIRATITSGLRSGKKRPVDLEHHQRLTRTEPSLSQAAFALIAARLAELCPLYAHQDVMEYLVARRLELGVSADVFALPAPAEQRQVVAVLVEEFGREPLAQTGLIKRMPAGEPDLSRFVWPEHRLGVIWRGPDGSAQTIERRFTGNRDTDRRWVFPAQRGAAWPLGWNELVQATPDRSVVIVEGPSDYLAVRAWMFVKSRTANVPVPVALALASATKLRPEWLRSLMDRRVYVALDSDEAGEEASARILAQLVAIGIDAERSCPPAPSKDWAAAWLVDRALTEPEVRAETRYLSEERRSLMEGTSSV